MGQHATIHGKNTTPVNGASGSWTPVKVDATGIVQVANTALVNGEITGIGRLAGGMIVNYTVISTNTTTVIKSGQAMYAGIFVYAAGTTSTVSVYDNTAASGTQLVNAEVTTAKGKIANDAAPNGMGLIMTNGITVVTAGAVAATIIVYWA